MWYGVFTKQYHYLKNFIQNVHPIITLFLFRIISICQANFELYFIAIDKFY